MENQTINNSRWLTIFVIIVLIIATGIICYLYINNKHLETQLDKTCNNFNSLSNTTNYLIYSINQIIDYHNLSYQKIPVSVNQINCSNLTGWL